MQVFFKTWRYYDSITASEREKQQKICTDKCSTCRFTVRSYENTIMAYYVISKLNRMHAHIFMFKNKKPESLAIVF